MDFKEKTEEIGYSNIYFSTMIFFRSTGTGRQIISEQYNQKKRFLKDAVKVGSIMLL